MAKKDSTPASKVSAGIGKVSTAIAAAYGKHASSGEFLTQVCKICADVFGGKPANSIDQKRVASDVARLRAWSKVSEGPRKSEVRKIVRNYARFDEAAAKYRETNDTFSWHTAMRLLTCLNKEPALRPALALMVTGNATKAKVAPLKAVGTAVSRIMNIDTKASKVTKFQTALEHLCITHEIDW